MTHTVIPTCLLRDFDDRIELAFGTAIRDEDVRRIEDLIKDRFPWCSFVLWHDAQRVTLRKPNNGE